MKRTTAPAAKPTDEAGTGERPMASSAAIVP
jgi:hypothetical protein